MLGNYQIFRKLEEKMAKQEEYVSYNRADMLYETIYRKIIQPIIEAEINYDVFQYSRMVKSLIEITMHFYSDKDKGEELRKQITKIQKKTIEHMYAKTNEQRIQNKEGLQKCYEEIADIKIKTFEMMHKCKLFVLTDKKDERPAAVKSVG